MMMSSQKSKCRIFLRSSSDILQNAKFGVGWRNTSVDDRGRYIYLALPPPNVSARRPQGFPFSLIDSLFVVGQYGSYSSELCAITYFTLLANSAINPIIYCSRVPTIRRHVVKLLRRTADVQRTDESEGYLTVVAL